MDSLVRRFQSSLMIAALFVPCAGALFGCGNGYGAYPATAVEASERILRARGALERAKGDPLAGEVRLDLQRAESWIGTAEADTKGSAADERVDLYLSTAEGQLSMIQTHYARRRAEEKLEKRREQALAPASEPERGGGAP